MGVCNTFLGIIGSCFFMHEICQMRITKNKKYMTLAIGFVLLAVVAFQLTNRMMIFVIVGSVLEMIAVIVLFQTDFWRGCSVFLFTISYYTVIYYPIKIAGSIICKSEERGVIVAKIISLLIIVLIGNLIRKNENLLYNIRKARRWHRT